MLVDVVLQDEFGKVIAAVGDPQRYIPWPSDDSSFPLLQYVDPYGDTVFNRTQMDQVIRDLEALASRTENAQSKDAIARVRQLAVRCRDEVHLYLKFVGD